jgi:hypothetical protein
MPKATTSNEGDLNQIKNCYIKIAGKTINFRILPDISDGKSASYSDESIIGRSFPVKTYSHSENRSISIEIHFITLKESDIEKNIREMRLIQSACYPRNGNPYRPPPVCQIKCGKLLGNNGVCAILKSYQVKFPTDQVWDENTLLPYKFDVSTTWEVVYASSSLPGQEKIASTGA